MKLIIPIRLLSLLFVLFIATKVNAQIINSENKNKAKLPIYFPNTTNVLTLDGLSGPEKENMERIGKEIKRQQEARIAKENERNAVLSARNPFLNKNVYVYGNATINPKRNEFTLRKFQRYNLHHTRKKYIEVESQFSYLTMIIQPRLNKDLFVKTIFSRSIAAVKFYQEPKIRIEVYKVPSNIEIEKLDEYVNYSRMELASEYFITLKKTNTPGLYNLENKDFFFKVPSDRNYYYLKWFKLLYFVSF